MENKLLKIETIVKNDSLNKNFMREVMGGTSSGDPCLVDSIFCKCFQSSAYEQGCPENKITSCPDKACVDGPTPTCPKDSVSACPQKTN